MKFFNPVAYQALAQSVKASPLLNKPVAPATPAVPPDQSEPTRRRRRTP